MQAPPSLSIVMPVYNEPYWIAISVADAITAIERSAFNDVEFIIVDDGSSEETQLALDQLKAPFPLRVIRQENKGRFLARREGVRAAQGALILLLDARVSLAPDSLKFITDRSAPGEPLEVWNAHSEIDLKRNPYARFWNVITEVAYRDYCANPRTMSYGIEEYDRYPKGTTCFIAPRAPLLAKMENFNSLYADSRDANDDTNLIRPLAAEQAINISPGFACLYRSRDALRPFLKHAFHRGKHFVDGWAHVGGRFFGVIVAFYPLSVVTVVVCIRSPRILVLIGLAAPVAAASAGAMLRRSRADCAALAALGLPWVCVYGAGMWRGLWLASRGRLDARLAKAR